MLIEVEADQVFQKWKNHTGAAFSLIILGWVNFDSRKGYAYKEGCWLRICWVRNNLMEEECVGELGYIKSIADRQRCQGGCRFANHLREFAKCLELWVLLAKPQTKIYTRLLGRHLLTCLQIVHDTFCYLTSCLGGDSSTLRPFPSLICFIGWQNESPGANQEQGYCHNTASIVVHRWQSFQDPGEFSSSSGTWLP